MAKRRSKGSIKGIKGIPKGIVRDIDPVTLLMTERNLDLQKDLISAQRTIEEQRKEIDILYRTLTRPSYSTFSEQQIDLLAELICVRMTDFSSMKKAHVH